MILLCISEYTECFTKGTLYEIIEKVPNGYKIIDDNNDYHSVTNEHDNAFLDRHFAVVNK